MSQNPSKDPQALSDPSTWVGKHGDFLFRYALFKVGNTTLAEDLVQETFLAALKAGDSFEGKSDERTWLVGILKNKIVDHFRKTGPEVRLETSEQELHYLEESFKNSELGPGSWKSGRRPKEWVIDSSDPVESKEFWKFLELCLSKLPARDSQAFVLREMEEIKAEEICNKLGVTPTNLRVLLHRVRLSLRRCLEKNWLAIRRKNR